ncbi:MAG: hypothetical protein HW418_1280, partial [Anaerolineales bacterium]|nr:hypothetical protein [Anaerolineales bacterium]
HQVVHYELYLVFGERTVFPVVDKGFVVGVADAARPRDQLALAGEAPDAQRAAPLDSLGDAASVRPRGEMP